MWKDLMKIAKSVETYKEEKKIPNMQVEIGKEFVNLLKTFCINQKY